MTHSQRNFDLVFPLHNLDFCTYCLYQVLPPNYLVDCFHNKTLRFRDNFYFSLVQTELYSTEEAQNPLNKMFLHIFFGTHFEELLLTAVTYVCNCFLKFCVNVVSI
jgi:hypothetical protein